MREARLAITRHSSKSLGLRKAFALCAASGALAFASSVTPAMAAFPGGNGRIAYVGRDGDIYTVKPFGGEVTRLTATGRDDSPSWSADGKFLTFARDQAGDPSAGQIWVMAADGSGQHQALPAPPGARDRQPTWSPDGKHLVFTRRLPGDNPNCGGSLFEGDLQTHQTRQLLPESCESHPVFSPDGERIAYVHGFPQTTVKIFTLGGGTVGTVTGRGAPTSVDWSPDGTQLVLGTGTDPTGIGITNRNIVRVDIDGSGWRPLTHLPACFCDASQARAPVFSPDGQQVAYEFTDASTLIDYLKVVSRDGGRTRRVVTEGFEPSWQPR